MKNAFYAAIGATIYYGLHVVDAIRTVVKVQNKRRLDQRERSVLLPIFRHALRYDDISIVEGNAGVLGITGRPFTMGFTIYMPVLSDATLVHECVHVWQFQFEGRGYVGNSALHQLNAMVFSGYDPYDWSKPIDAGATWSTLESAEAQAKFIEDVFVAGEFVYRDPSLDPDTGPGAFFREADENGQNRFVVGNTDYTTEANDAWRILTFA